MGPAANLAAGSLLRLCEVVQIAREAIDLGQQLNETAQTFAWRRNAVAIQYAGQQWIMRALVNDQLMDLSVPYWEGAVEILDAGNLDPLGQGYLEMVRN